MTLVSRAITSLKSVDIPSAPPSRTAVLDVAKSYAEHRWRATERNAFHGTDDNGVRVDTPDPSVTGVGWKVGDNVGVPYSWGGFSSLDDFDRGVANGACAGHILLHGRVGNPRASRLPVGVDCSGLVSRCWALPRHFSTRDFPSISIALGSYDELRPGDILNAPADHVLLFEAFLDDTHVSVLEAGAWKVKRTHWSYADLTARGLVPLRDRRRK